MLTHTITTIISPMNDADLRRNFKTLRRRYWIRHGLWIPDDVIVKFERIKRRKCDIGKPALLGECDPDSNVIRIIPILRYVWVQAHTTLLHEMAHLSVRVLKRGDGRFRGHGESFNNEIDRLYALGAFRKLI
jgi:hypothetical protein